MKPLTKRLTDEELDTNQNPSSAPATDEQTCLAYLTVADLRLIIREETKWLEK